VGRPFSFVAGRWYCDAILLIGVPKADWMEDGMAIALLRFGMATLAAGLLLSFAATVSAAPSGADNPLARIEDRLCPGISGLREQAALQVLDRIRDNAERVGIRLANPDDCRPNLLVFFVDDPSHTLDRLMTTRPEMFSAMTSRERKELIEEQRPVRAWSQVLTRSRDGLEVRDSDNLVEIPRTTMWAAHSKIYVPVRRDIVSTIMLFGSAGVAEMSLTQLADFVTMRAFADDFTAFPEDQPSILGLFDGGDLPAELTEADRVFLDTLYSGIANMPGKAKNMALRNNLENLRDR